VFLATEVAKAAYPEIRPATEFGETCHAVLPLSLTELPKFCQIWQNRQIKQR
jgi:hypothetical protein